MGNGDDTRRRQHKRPVVARSPMRDAIRKRRIEAGLSCKELSAYAQVGSNYIRHLENGHGGAHLEVLERICTILDLTLQPAPKKANRSKHGSNLGHDHNCYKEGS